MESKKRPADLAALRKRQLQKRKLDKGTAEPLAPPALFKIPSQTAKTKLVPKSFLVKPVFNSSIPAIAAGVPAGGDVPVGMTQPGGDLEFKLFGKTPAAAVPAGLTGSDDHQPPPILQRNQSQNPFPAAGGGQEELKGKNPFSLFGSIPLEDLMEEREEVDMVDEVRSVEFTAIGSHVSQALRSHQRREVLGPLAPSFVRSYSCPGGLLSPHVSVAKKSGRSIAAFAGAARHYKADSDFSESGDEEDDGDASDRQGYMSDQDLSDTERRPPTVQPKLEAKKPKKKTAKPPPLEPPPLPSLDAAAELDVEADPRTNLMGLFEGKRQQRGEMTTEEFSAISGLAKPRKIIPKASRTLSNMGDETTESKSQSATDGTVAPQAGELPIDWTLKEGMSLLSRLPFTSAAPLGPEAGSTCLLRFARQSDTAANGAMAALQPLLYHWAHPSEKPPPAHVVAMVRVLSKNADGAGFNDAEHEEFKHFKAAEAAWTESFTSLYTLFDTSHVSYFYYINSQFSVLFLDDPKSFAGKVAVLACASFGLRRVLDDEGIAYEMVATTGKKSGPQLEKTASQEAPGAGDGTEVKPQNPGDSPIKDRRDVPDAKTQPAVLRFSTPTSVQQLFQYLLKWKEPRIERRAAGFPSLLALTPFLHACLKTARIVKNDKVGYAVPAPASTGSTSNTTTTRQTVETLHKLELTGHILPTNVKAILELLRNQQARSSDNTSGESKPGLLLGQLATVEGTVGVNSGVGWVGVGEVGMEKGERARVARRRKVGTVRTFQFKGEVVKWK
ncbi:uncharacterized protein EV422DRAFT_548812 [Fimicolochytrium jonesii]|uniref:uncharacterized protein n=1 Tax=Fimicolochytrium jonesii TaxID=1396493 RepID=UPI0022FE61C9|nr:uncharacterized protein EV422DRAFT_548812 [Fimicolochytrium jonesii]KAI8815633.1 hypothetical protein EV422DRAFT_548812 [Fimicolochytrium jonesii]